MSCAWSRPARSPRTRFWMRGATIICSPSPARAHRAARQAPRMTPAVPRSPPMREAEGATLAIDQATRCNLELMRTLSGERQGSLLSAIDRTVTPAGSRLLAQRLAAPLTAPDAIARRHDAVALFVADAMTRGDVRARLNAAPDLARSLARLVVGRGGPRDLAAIRDGVAAAAGLAGEIDAQGNAPAEIAQAAAALRRPAAAIAAELAAALADELPAFKR